MGTQQKGRVVHALGETQALLPEFSCGLEIYPSYSKRKQSPQRREEL
ncbi:MAG: hypothetical protein HYZ72_18570 [Deltaproteobacteria bacterium]|nr:hypothetical protein [Deltaproteobacteria bacterium]